MRMTPLDGLGVEIDDVDIKALSADDFAAVKAAFAEHGVIFFRNQDTTENDHIGFAERFGDININRFFAAHPDYPQIALVAKEPDQKDNIGGGWHTDHSYDHEPALGSVLVARELPESGGRTVTIINLMLGRTMMAQIELAMRKSLKCWPTLSIRL